MPAIDPTKSAFSQVRELIVESEIATDTNWRSHAVDKITSMSKAAVVAIGMTVFMGGALAHDHHHQTMPNAATEAVTQMEVQGAKQSSADAQFARTKELADLYIRDLIEGKSQASWAKLRPNVKIFTQYGEYDIGGKETIAERVGIAERIGMVDKDFRGAKSLDLVNEVDSMISAIGRSDQSPAASISLASAYLKPAQRPEGSFCTVSFNPHVDKIHDEIKKITGWPDDVVRDHVIRHEATHCIEQADRNGYILKELDKTESVTGPLISDKSKLLFESTIAKMKRAPSTDHPDDQARENIMSAMLKTVNRSSSKNGEEISDALPVLSLIKEGRLEVKGLSEMALMRSKSNLSGEMHNTSSFLSSLERELKKTPEVVDKWRADHAKEMASGSGLQVGALLDWVAPRWKAHADARDNVDERRKELREISDLPADSGAKSLGKTANHFMSMLKVESPAPSRKPKP